MSTNQVVRPLHGELCIYLPPPGEPEVGPRCYIFDRRSGYDCAIGPTAGDDGGLGGAGLEEFRPSAQADPDVRESRANGLRKAGGFNKRDGRRVGKVDGIRVLTGEADGVCRVETIGARREQWLSGRYVHKLDSLSSSCGQVQLSNAILAFCGMYEVSAYHSGVRPALDHSEFTDIEIRVADDGEWTVAGRLHRALPASGSNAASVAQRTSQVMMGRGRDSQAAVRQLMEHIDNTMAGSGIGHVVPKDGHAAGLRLTRTG